MDIMKLGTELLLSKITGGAQADNGAVQAALAGLIGQGDGLDIAGLVSSMQSGDLADIAKSWLGDGSNASISQDQIRGMVDGGKLSQLAAAVGSDESSVLSGLQEAMPQMVDKSSSGGSLLDAVGGLSEAADLAKGLFK